MANNNPTQALRRPEMPEAEATPIEEQISKLQDAGRNVYIAGWTENGRHCLIVDVDNGRCSIATRYTCNGLGRLECSINHRNEYAELYAEWFPRNSLEATA
jgi:hypothetical protein